MNKALRLLSWPRLLIFLLLWGVWAWYVLQHNGQRPAQESAVIVEHRVVPLSGGAVVGVPDPPFVLARADAVGLSTSQRARVKALADAYCRRAEFLQRSLDEAARKLAQELSGASRKRLSAHVLEQETAPLVALSSQLAALRAEAWVELEGLLTWEQCARAKAAWADAHRLRSPGRAREPSAGG